MLVDFDEISDGSRIWIYASTKRLTSNQQHYILDSIAHHIKDWQSHQNPLKAAVKVLEDYFIIVALDESYEKASGCSIDALQNNIQNIEKELNISLLDRLNVYIVKNGEIESIPLFKLKGSVDQDAFFYDLTINYKKDIETYLKPIKDGWCYNYLD